MRVLDAVNCACERVHDFVLYWRGLNLHSQLYSLGGFCTNSLRLKLSRENRE